MTPEAAQEFARDLYDSHPAAAALLLEIAHGEPPAQARAKAALKILVPNSEAPPPLPPKRPRALWEGARAALEELDRFTAADFSDRTTTGIASLDRRLRGGLRGGQMTLLGAPTGAGKTSFAQQLATAAARQGRGTVLLVSPEMSLESLAEREIIRTSGRTLWDRNPWMGSGPLRDGCISDHARAAAEIYREKLPIRVLEDLSVSMDDIERAAEAEAQHGKLALVIIDYAQEVAGEADAKTPRYLQVGEVGGRSVDLSLRYDVPVLVASQVNVEQKGNKRTYSFRETQVLQHKANTVLILDVQWGTDSAGERTVDFAEIVCQKQRGYSTFRLEVEYDPALFQISERRAWRQPAQYQHQLLPPPVPA